MTSYSVGNGAVVIVGLSRSDGGSLKDSADNYDNYTGWGLVKKFKNA
jgi:hypothetical protein